MQIGDREHVVGRPAIIEAVRPHSGQPAARELHDLLIGEGVPFVDDDRVELVVVRAGSGAGVEERHRLVQIVGDGRVPLQERLDEVLGELLRHYHPITVVVVRRILAPVDEAHRLRAEPELA